MAEHKDVASFELKDIARGTFRAIFSRLGVVDKDNDVTVPGAFKRGQKVRVAQWGHNWDVPAIGDGRIDADDQKAWVDGQFYLDVPAAADTYAVVKRLSAAGLQEWSYGYVVEDHARGSVAGQPVRLLKRLSVIEVSPVMRGAGVDTTTDFIKGYDRLGRLEVLELEKIRARALGVRVDPPTDPRIRALEWERERARRNGVPV